MALLRSDKPGQRGDAVLYYEVQLTADGTVTVQRFQASHQPETKRQPVEFTLTHDAIAKLAADIAALYGEMAPAQVGHVQSTLTACRKIHYKRPVRTEPSRSLVKEAVSVLMPVRRPGVSDRLIPRTCLLARRYRSSPPLVSISPISPSIVRSIWPLMKCITGTGRGISIGATTARGRWSRI